MSAPKAPLLSPPPTSVPLQQPPRQAMPELPRPGQRPSAPAAPQVPAVIHPAWNAWFSKLYNVAKPLGGSDVTANRPTEGLFVGYPFFDTTLGIPIWVQSLNPTVWVNATGGAV
jgi:hypothetical protein